MNETFISNEGVDKSMAMVNGQKVKFKLKSWRCSYCGQRNGWNYLECKCCHKPYEEIG
jgi:hypothetical protein